MLLAHLRRESHNVSLKYGHPLAPVVVHPSSTIFHKSSPLTPLVHFNKNLCRASLGKLNVSLDTCLKSHDQSIVKTFQIFSPEPNALR